MFEQVSNFFSNGGDFMIPIAGILVLVLAIAIDKTVLLIRRTTDRRRFEQGLRHLPTLGYLAMLLGVMGTFSGMIVGFSSECYCDAEEKLIYLCRCISWAMNCTAFGLAIAIVAKVVHNLLCAISESRLQIRIDNRVKAPYVESKRPATLLLAPSACLLVVLMAFLLVGMSLYPVEAIPVRFVAGQETYSPNSRFLVVSPGKYELRTLNGQKLEIPASGLSSPSIASLATGRDLPEKREIVVVCSDLVSLQELVSVLSDCRASGVEDLIIADSSALPLAHIRHH